MSQRPRYTVARDPASVRFGWLVVDASGKPKNAKLGRVPLRFKTQAVAQAHGRSAERRRQKCS